MERNIPRSSPQVLVKGKDWAYYVRDRGIVEANGGRVVLADRVDGKSTTNTIKNIVQVYGNGTRSNG